MTETEQASLDLPGLGESARKPGSLAAAVRRSIVALHDDGLVAERDAARLQLALELADIIEIKKRTGRMSTVGNDARVLVDLLDSLLPEESSADEQLRTAMEEWNRLIAEQDAAARTATP